MTVLCHLALQAEPCHGFTHTYRRGHLMWICSFLVSCLPTEMYSKNKGLLRVGLSV